MKLKDLKVGDLILWNGKEEYIRKIENEKIYISHLCGYSIQEINNFIKIKYIKIKEVVI